MIASLKCVLFTTYQIMVHLIWDKESRTCILLLARTRQAGFIAAVAGCRDGQCVLHHCLA